MFLVRGISGYGRSSGNGTRTDVTKLVTSNGTVVCYKKNKIQVILNIHSVS